MRSPAWAASTSASVLTPDDDACMSNQYTYIPPCTAEELHRLYWDEGMSQDEMAAHLGTTQKVICRAMRKAAIPRRRQIKRDQNGERNSTWKGGRILCAAVSTGEHQSNGYWYVLDPTHPAADKRGYVAEHVKVALEQDGRESLDQGEHVHHINLDKHDNQPSNLVIGTGKQHGAWHGSLQREAAKLINLGLMTFDPATGYRLALPGMEATE